MPSLEELILGKSFGTSLGCCLSLKLILSVNCALGTTLSSSMSGVSYNSLGVLIFRRLVDSK